MISYETKENIYNFNVDELNKVIQKCNNGNTYAWQEEDVNELINLINTFLQNIKPEMCILTKERHETEEEAREYFGQEFIDKLNSLLTTLDRQKTIVSIHGTDPSNCQSICDNGLMYKSPAITATACGQSMNYGTADMDYQEFESLLNWGHKHYKGLVLLAIPYECYYREGLWNHFREGEYSEYNYEYKINPDFVVGYIDVDQKQIILNPKYKREHDYTGLERDTEIFREKKDMDNEKLAEALAKSKLQEKENQRVYQPPKKEEIEEVDVSELSSLVGELTGLFNSINNGNSTYMSEEKHKYYLEQINYVLGRLNKIAPLMNTRQKFTSVFDSFPSGEPLPQTESTSQYFSDVWGDDIDWGFPPAEEPDNSPKHL